MYGSLGQHSYKKWLQTLVFSLLGLERHVILYCKHGDLALILFSKSETDINETYMNSTSRYL